MSTPLVPLAARTPVQAVVKRHLPEHIREDYPTFVAFVEAYYEFLQSQGVNLSTARDIDETLDSFIGQFKKELAVNLPNTVQDERFLLRKIKDQYLSKGSEASYKLLFRLLYGKEVEIFYPGQQMLRASDGRWNQELSVFARVDFGDAEDVIGKLVDIRTETSVIKVLVDRKKQIFTDSNSVIIEFFLDRSFFGEVKVGDIIRLGDQFQATVIPTTSRVRIVQPGKNFKVGQVFELRSGSGTSALLKVTEVTDTGGIKYCEIIKFGVNYTANFSNGLLSNNTINSRVDVAQTASTLVSDLTYESDGSGTISADPDSFIVTGSGTSFGSVGNPKIGDELWTDESPPKLVGVIKSIQNTTSLTLVDKPSIHPQSIPSVYTGSYVYRNNDSVGVPYELVENTSNFTYTSTLRSLSEGFNEQGYVNYADYVDSQFVDGTYVGSLVREFTLTFRNAQVQSDEPAIIDINLGAVARYPGYYETNNGFLDDSIVIQDSNYYQIFSYVLKIDERLSSYKSAVKTMIHPAGMALFAEFNIFNEYDLSLGVEARAISLGVNIADVVDGETDSISLTFMRPLSSSISIESDITVGFSSNKVFSSEQEISDELSEIKTTKYINTSVDIQDTLSISYGAALSSEQSITESLAKQYLTNYSSELGSVTDLDVSYELGLGLLTETLVTDDFTNLTTKGLVSEIQTPEDSLQADLVIGLDALSTTSLNDNIDSLSIDKTLTEIVNVEDNIFLVLPPKYIEDVLAEQSNLGYVQVNSYAGQDYVIFEDEYDENSRVSSFSS